MHTDDYEMALQREVDVCAGHIRSLKNTVALMETRYNLPSEALMGDPDRHRAVVGAQDLQAWSEACAALTIWMTRKQEYEKFHRMLKI